MIALKQILLPIDFSDSSAVATRYACELAQAFDARLHLLHVLENPFLYPAGEGYIPPPPNLLDDLERTARDRLARLIPESNRQALGAQIATPRGSPFVEIVRYAKEKDIDLIVMGSHGRGPIAHMLMGSVAEKVVRKAPCPVLTVREKQHDFVMP